MWDYDYEKARFIIRNKNEKREFPLINLPLNLQIHHLTMIHNKMGGLRKAKIGIVISNLQKKFNEERSNMQVINRSTRDIHRLYYWLKNVSENRPTGPWWYKDFNNDVDMKDFFLDMRNINCLHAYSHLYLSNVIT